MKTKLLPFFLLVFALSHSQDYIPILNEENIWSLFGSDGLSGTSGSDFYQFSGNEIINGKTYKILYIDDTQLECRFREENGVLYAYNPITDLDEVRLDFTLEVGDTFDVATISNGGLNYCIEGITNLYEYLEVIAVDTQFIAGEDRKVLTMSSMSANGNPIELEQYWIEGIGSTSGMFGTGVITYEILTELMCFDQNGVITFFNGFDECEVDGLGIGDNKLKDIQLFPNPATDQITLSIPAIDAADQLNILDINGRLLESQSIVSLNTNINLIKLQPGVYFCQLFSKGKLLKTQKFIVR